MEEVGRYRVHRRIAHGGMAEVFEATAEGARGFARRVAIKRMLADHGEDPSFARMFLDEARIASQLHHASIVAVLDYGVADGRPFQALELVDGGDAHALTRRAAKAGEPLPVELALHICAEIAHALAYAHEALDANGRPMGIVHRDVSPGNILLSWNGDVKLTDFGIAKASEREEKTQAGVAKGKLAYMSPEQATAGAVDARADVFSLGCVLHALLLGKSPLKDPEAMRQLFGDGEIQITDALPEDVRAIIVKSTRRDASARYASADEMAKALGEAAAPRFRTTPRAALCAWLEKLAPSSRRSAKSGGKLDDLLDVDLVLGATDESGVRQFESTEKSSASPTVRATPARSEDPSALTVPTRSRPRVVLGVSVVVGVAALGTALVMSASPSATGESAGATEIGAGPALGSSQADAPSRPEAAPPRPEADNPPPPTVVGAEPTRETATRRPRRPTVEASAMDQEGPHLAADSVEATATGVLLIGGAGAHRMEIFVDGRSRGFAPKRLDLSVGGHAVELRTAEGAEVATRRIEVLMRHTRTSPERWIVD